MGEVALLLRTAARAEIMPRYRRLTNGDVKTKSGPLDLVTDADLHAERLITHGLATLFPGCVVIGEEAAAADPELLHRLEDADLAFVVDPLDGTSNFAAGLPPFGTMAAAIVRGEIAAAVIHDPVGDDCCFALRGEGAWVEASEGDLTDLRVAPPTPLHEMTGVASWRYLPEPERSAVCRNLPRRLAACWDYRCAAHQYRLIAGGHCHFLLYYRLMPWDHAPGVLLLREAGGYAASFAGAPYSPRVRGGGLICTPDEAGWQALRSALLQ
ncbi:MAG TPA: inositol monophosphatase family protein [Acetobacteraceae bacterium]|nr:inositol monophosphatase family protein [Acetobacteraceae bacterium]